MRFEERALRSYMSFLLEALQDQVIILLLVMATILLLVEGSAALNLYLMIKHCFFKLFWGGVSGQFARSIRIFLWKV